MGLGHQNQYLLPTLKVVMGNIFQLNILRHNSVGHHTQFTQNRPGGELFPYSLITYLLKRQFRPPPNSCTDYRQNIPRLNHLRVSCKNSHAIDYLLQCTAGSIILPQVSFIPVFGYYFLRSLLVQLPLGNKLLIVINWSHKDFM